MKKIPLKLPKKFFLTDKSIWKKRSEEKGQKKIQKEARAIIFNQFYNSSDIKISLCFYIKIWTPSKFIHNFEFSKCFTLHEFNDLAW